MATYNVSNGVTSTGLTVASGQTLVVSSGGTVSSTTVSAGGLETVSGTAVGDTIYGSAIAAGAAALTNETVQSGGTLTLNATGGTATNTTVNAGGLVIDTARDAAINTVLNGGTFELASPKSTLSGSLLFNAPSTLLVSTFTSAPSSSAFGDQAVISGFAAGDAVDDQVIAFNGATVTYGSDANNDLTQTVSGFEIVSGVVTSTLTTETFLYSGLTAANFTSSADVNGGTQLAYVACYCEGTLVRTGVGDVAVEDLAVGDHVVTMDGRHEPIRWIGRRSYNGRALAGRIHLLPIRIKAGALAANEPSRDLLVSPLHAMLIDGVLVPASALLNGTSIVREEATVSVSYVHIELDRHEVIWAEGAPSETFIDDESSNRLLFQATGGEAACFPPVPYARRVVDGVLLERIRNRLAQRASDVVFA